MPSKDCIDGFARGAGAIVRTRSAEATNNADLPMLAEADPTHGGQASGVEAVTERIRTDVSEILDYFGLCADCPYPASASLLRHHYSDGSTQREIIATCGLPCGWRAPVSPTRMTRPHGSWPKE
ncbi:hypothetical protein ACW9HC_22940 [Nocardia gipuzkoensis]